MRHILLATDFSKGAQQALDRAVRLAVQSAAPLDVIHAAPDDDQDDGVLHGRLLGDAHRAAARIGAGGIEIRSIVSVRDPRKAILDRAEKIGADLIVLGGHGEPRFRDAIFGTTGTHVVRHSTAPVLIVQTDPALPYAKLMIAVDSAEAAPRLVESALEIAPAAEVFAVHALHTSFIDRLGGDEVLDDLAACEVQAMQSALARVAAAHPSAQIGARRHVIADPGDAITVLRDETERLVPDLVVMGTHDRGAYFSSRAVDACFWCPADLLIVPEAAPVPVDA